MESIWSYGNWLLGLDQETLSVWQMSLRAVLVYIFGLILVRIGEKRFIGKFAAVDVIMGVMIGSILAGAITSAENFFPTLAGALVLVGMHFAFAALAFHYDRFGEFVKGKAHVLVRDGQIEWKAMGQGHISQEELEAALRENVNTDDVRDVKEARLERSGNISAILKKD